MNIATVRSWHNEAAGTHGTQLLLWCPGCDGIHAVEVETAPRWDWDGNMDAPTVTPSIKVTGTQWETGRHFHRPNHHVSAGAQTTCHSFVRGGHWEFLADCTHHLAGQTVPLPPLPDFLEQ